jgi:MoxR-like ATPase
VDLTDLVLDVFRHRLVLSYEALTDEVSADEVLTRVLAALAVPEVAPGALAR